MPSKLQGNRQVDGDTAWIACYNLTEWQIEKMLDCCIEIESEEISHHTSHAVRINVNDEKMIIRLILEEDIKCLFNPKESSR